MAKQGMSTIGIEIKIDETEISYVTEFGDIGGSPSTLDVTCLMDSVKRSIPGVQDNGTFEVTYLFDNTATNSNYRTLKQYEQAGGLLPVLVYFPEGTVFASMGYISTYVTGSKVDDLVMAKLVVNLQADWNVTNPTGSTGS